MIASKPKNIYCAVPGCAMKEQPNSGWYVIPGSLPFLTERSQLIFKKKKADWLKSLNIAGVIDHEEIHICPQHFNVEKDVCGTLTTKNSESIENAAYLNAATKEHTLGDRSDSFSEKDPKQKTTRVCCIVPNCDSGGKTNPVEKWYILPGFRRLEKKDSLDSQKFKAMYSEHNLPNKYLNKSIQICPKHYPKKDSNESNISICPHTEDFEDKLQRKIIFKPVPPTNFCNLLEINLRREDLSLEQPALNLMCSSGKPTTRQNIAIAYNDQQEQNSVRAPELTEKPCEQINLSINMDLNTSEMERRNDFSNNVESVSPISNDVQVVDENGIINPESVCNESAERGSSIVKSKQDDRRIKISSETFNKANVHTKDVGVQTNDTSELGDILHFIRTHILNFAFLFNGQRFVINNTALFFQPVEYLKHHPIIVEVKDHTLYSSSSMFLQAMDYNIQKKMGKPPTEPPREYAYINGMYQNVEAIRNLINTESRNVIKEVNSEFVDTAEGESFQNVCNDTNTRNIIVSSNDSECSSSYSSTKIDKVERGGTTLPNVTILKHIVIKDTKLQKELTNLMETLPIRTSNTNNLNMDSHSEVPNSNNSPMLRNTGSNFENNNQMNILEQPKIRVIDIAKLRNIEVHEETTEHTVEKTIIDASKEIGTEKEDSSLRNNKSTKHKVKEKVKLSCEINRKRKSSNQYISTKTDNKKGRYVEMIGELEKFLEVALEKPSEDNMDLLSLDDSYNSGYAFSPSPSCSGNNDKCLELLQKEDKSPDRKKQIKVKVLPNELMLTRSKTKTVKNSLSRNKLTSKRNRLKVKNNIAKISDYKNSKYNNKSIATPKKPPKNKFVNKIESTVVTNENPDQGQNLENYETLCKNCNQLMDPRILSCHLKNCSRKTMCHKCGLMIDGRVMWCHLKVCFPCKCEECGFTFSNLSLLRKHLKKLKHCFLCEKCNVIFVRSGRSIHEEKCRLPHRTRNMPVKYFSYISSNNSKRFCRLCMQEFQSLKKFTKHVYLSHNNEEHRVIWKMKNKILKKYMKNKSERCEYKCRFCGYLFINMSEKIDHYEICLKRIVENCTIKTEEGTYIEAEVIM